MIAKTQCPVCHAWNDQGAKYCKSCGAWESLWREVNTAPAVEASPSTTRSASEIVQAAADAISQRAASRDLPQGERSMARTVASFNGLMGRQVMTETEGWLFMCCLKMARATAGKHNLDDYTDLAGYAGLAGECGEMAQAANDGGEEVMQYGKTGNG